MKMSVIIPVWNGEAVLEECLSALLRDFAPNQMQVICVDNASADNSAAVVRMMHPDIQLLVLPAASMSALPQPWVS
jgi:glycosyltransferase involved in cell wall biosynthesis